MRLTLLGTGTPRPSLERNCTANLVQVGDENILFDAGRGVTTQLLKAGLHPRDIDTIFITHHHFDHIGNLDDLLLAAWNDGRKQPISVFGPHGTAAIIDQMFNGIYARDIDFRLKEAVFLGYEMPDIRDLVQVTDIKAGTEIKTAHCLITPFSVCHGHAMDLDQDSFPCFGYRIETADKILAISGDTIDCKGVRKLAKGADLLLQCCYMAEAEIDSPVKTLLGKHVLASAKQANAIARSAQVTKMVLTHLSPKSDAMLHAVLSEAQSGFAGQVILGHDMLTLEV